MTTLITDISIVKKDKQSALKILWEDISRPRDEHSQKIIILMDDVPQSLIESLAALKEDVIDMCYPYLTKEQKIDVILKLEILGVKITHKADDDETQYYGAVVKCQKEVKCSSPLCFNTPLVSYKHTDVIEGNGMSKDMKTNIDALIKIATSIAVDGERNIEGKLL